MPASGAVTLFHVRGIRIGVDYSWFFVLFLIIIWLSSFYRDRARRLERRRRPLPARPGERAAFFGSILLHELGHAFVAMRRGIGISDITLWMFGGVARMTRDSDSPGHRVQDRDRGPAGHPGDRHRLRRRSGSRRPDRDEFWQAMRVRGPGRHLGRPRGDRLAGEHQPAGAGLQPDPRLPARRRTGRAGHRLEVTGDRNRATRVAARLGQGFSYLFIAVGIVLLLTGRSDRRHLAGADRLHPRAVGPRRRRADRVRRAGSRAFGVADVMDQRAGRDPGGRQRRARPGRVLPAIPVAVVPGGRRRPAVPRPDRARRRRRRSRAGRASSTVREVFEADSTGTLRVRDDAPLESLLGNDALRRLGALMAVDADGRLRGVITADQVGRALRSALSGGRREGPAARPPALGAGASRRPRYRIAPDASTTY